MGKQGFEPRLESLRGIAALIVALSHGMSAFAFEPGFLTNASTFLLRLVDPGAAVCFFFVLSGYVLGRSLEREFNPTAFYVRRFFRIFPMLAVSIVVAYVLRCQIVPGNVFAPSFVEAFSQRLGLDDLINNLLLRSFVVNGPSWSIYPEMVGSVFLPVLVFAHLKTPPRWQWPLFLALSIALAFSDLRMLIWFYSGFFLPSRIARLLRNDVARGATFIAGYVLLLHTVDNETYFKVKTLLPTSLAVCVMLAAVLSDTEFLSALTVRPLRFLGRNSYSFYLLHWPIFFAIASFAGANGLHGMTGNILVCTASIATTIAVSAVSYSLVERSSMKLSAILLAARSPAKYKATQSTAANS